MRDLGIETLGGPSRQVSDSIALGPGLVLQGTRIHFRRNEEVFGEGENAEYVYRVVSGAVRTIRFSSDGRRQILNFYLPGDVFGLGDQGVGEETAPQVAEGNGGAWNARSLR